MNAWVYILGALTPAAVGIVIAIYSINKTAETAEADRVHQRTMAREGRVEDRRAEHYIDMLYALNRVMTQIDRTYRCSVRRPLSYPSRTTRTSGGSMLS